MADTRPRDLTADERALLDQPATTAVESAPQRIPPGTNVAVELLDPHAKQAATASSPSAGPGETPV